MSSFLFLAFAVLFAHLWVAKNWLPEPQIWEFMIWFVLMSALALGLTEHCGQLWAAAGASLILSAAIIARMGARELALKLTASGLMWAVLLAVVQLGISSSWVELLTAMNIELETQSLLEEELSWALVAYVVVGAPIFEELLFRGFLFPQLLKEMGVNKAILCNGVAFGVMHWSTLQAVPPLICFGILLSILRWKHSSTSSCFVAHMINNATVLLCSKLALLCFCVQRELLRHDL